MGTQGSTEVDLLSCGLLRSNPALSFCEKERTAAKAKASSLAISVLARYLKVGFTVGHDGSRVGF